MGLPFEAIKFYTIFEWYLTILNEFCDFYNMTVQDKVLIFSEVESNSVQFDTGICNEVDANKLSGFKGLSQGFFEDEILSPIQASCSEA